MPRQRHDDHETLGRFLWRHSGRWYVTVMLIALLWANNRFAFHDPTGNWPAGAPTGNVGQPMPPEAWAVVRDGQLMCVDGGQELPSDRKITLVTYAYRSRPVSGGVPGVSTEMEQVVICGGVGGPPFDEAAVSAAYLAWLAQHPLGYWRNTAKRLQGAALVGSSVRWLEIGRVVANFALVALLVRSLAWTIPVFDAVGRWMSGAAMTPAERAALRRKKALLAGECPACGYDIRGLPECVCPECSHRWSPREGATIPAHTR